MSKVLGSEGSGGSVFRATVFGSMKENLVSVKKVFGVWLLVVVDGLWRRWVIRFTGCRFYLKVRELLWCRIGASELGSCIGVAFRWLHGSKQNLVEGSYMASTVEMDVL